MLYKRVAGEGEVAPRVPQHIAQRTARGVQHREPGPERRIRIGHTCEQQRRFRDVVEEAPRGNEHPHERNRRVLDLEPGKHGDSGQHEGEDCKYADTRSRHTGLRRRRDS